MLRRCAEWLAKVGRDGDTTLPCASTSESSQANDYAKCPVCANPFHSSPTYAQAQLHINSCLLANSDARVRTLMQSSEIVYLRECWARCFGELKDNQITISEELSETWHSRDKFADEPLSISLITLVQQHDIEVLGEDEEITQSRYLDYSQLNSSVFMCLNTLPLDLKKKWLYSQLHSFRVDYSCHRVNLEISADDIVRSTFNSLNALAPHDFHKEFKVHFTGDVGIDAGGLTREWFTLASKKLFDPNLGLFGYSNIDDFTFYINRHSGIHENHLEYFRMIGRFMGKAIFEKALIVAPLARPLVKQLLERPVGLEDLADLDFNLFTSLTWMRDNSIDDVFFETFSVSEEFLGETLEADLKTNGREIPVTDANKYEYIKLLTDFKLVRPIDKQLDSLKAGLWDVIPKSLLSIFDYQELDLLMNGLPELDVDDWFSHTVYDGKFHQKHKVIKWFWDAVKNSLSQLERARLLQFSTGTSHVPAEGFAALESNRSRKGLFTIRSLEWTETQPLPTANTCFNRLNLPLYRNESELRKYLHLGLQVDFVGFGMK